MGVSTFLYQMTHKPNGEWIPFTIYLFIAQTLIFGVAFVFFGFTDSVGASLLYIQSQAALGDLSVSFWGICAIVTALLNLFTLGIKRGTEHASFLGLLLWLYAVIIYANAGLWFQFILTVFMQVTFWLGFYLAVRKYERLNGEANAAHQN